MFDLEKHGDARYSHIQTGVSALPSSSDHRSGDVKLDARLGLQRHPSSGGGVSAPSTPWRLRQGKLEKSFLAFSMANPNWKVAEGAAGGEKFLSSLAETMYPSAAAGQFLTPPLSREASGMDGSTLGLRKPRAAAASVRFAPLPSPRADVALDHTRLPPVSDGMTRQDSLDSTTTDEFEEETTAQQPQPQQHAPWPQDQPPTMQPTLQPTQEDEAEREEGAEAADSKSASYLLSQSDRHLIQSFADLIGVDPALQLNPSTLLRQSSIGPGYGGAGGSMLGMSVMLGLHRRNSQQLQASPHAARGMQSSMLRSSHLGAGLGFHGGNSVLLGSALVPRGGGGLQAGLSASSMLHMDAQAMREQLMLAQADQQADLFALLEGRAEESMDEGAEEAEQEEQDQAEDDLMRSPIVSHTPPPFPSDASLAQAAHPFPSAATSSSSVASQAYPSHYSGTTYSRGSHATSPHSSPPSPPPRLPIDDDNEPPPDSFFH